MTRKASRTRMMNSSSNEVILPSILQTHSTHHRNTMCVPRGQHQEKVKKNSILRIRLVEPGALKRDQMTRRHCGNSSRIDQQTPDSLYSAQGEREHKTRARVKISGSKKNRPFPNARPRGIDLEHFLDQSKAMTPRMVRANAHRKRIHGWRDISTLCAR